ncbi:MAG: CBS domain-containing protein [Candidatus Gastranaerophilales bacterium]|nr:CBS domain-containing protein [Candidatus Gastranaerophilales bacterium]
MNGQSVSDFMSRKTLEQKSSRDKFTSIVVYPQNDAKELAKIMMDIHIDCLPVVSSPWNKKLIGFVEFNKIRNVLKD